MGLYMRVCRHESCSYICEYRLVGYIFSPWPECKSKVALEAGNGRVAQTCEYSMESSCLFLLPAGLGLCW
jgi:hypothetical protein